MITEGFKISLKALRVNAGFSIAEVAKLLKVSEEDVSAWEKCMNTPTKEQAHLLSVLYMVDEADLNYGKFKTAKEIFYNNVKMIKAADDAGYKNLYTDSEGVITGFYNSGMI